MNRRPGAAARRTGRAAVAVGCVCLSAGGGAQDLTSADLLAATAEELRQPFSGCMDYEVAGLCEWICLDPPYIPGGTTYVETSLLVRHHAPTAVVTVHAGRGCPWTEGRAVLAPFASASPLQGAARFGGGMSARGDGARPGTKGETLRPGAELGFYEAEVFGSVTGALVSQLAGAVPGLDFVCPPPVLPMPYYASVVDPLWRFGEPGMVAAAQDVLAHPPLGRGLRETVGGVPLEWGTLFPLSGWMDAGHDYRNAAVVAQRAVFVATNRSFGLPAPGGANLHVRAGMAGGNGVMLPAPSYPAQGAFAFGGTAALGALRMPAFGSMPELPALGRTTGFGGLAPLPRPAGVPASPLPVPPFDILERSGEYRFGGWGTMWLPRGVAPGGGQFKWRQVLPDVAGCHVFATPGTSGTVPFAGTVEHPDGTLLADPLIGRMNKDGGYAWQLWREYECCTNPCVVRVAGPLRIGS